MLQHKFVQVANRKKLTCNDCIKEKECNPINPSFRCTDGKFKILNNYTINDTNAEWYLQRLIFDVEIAKNSASIEKSRLRIEWLMPKSLQSPFPRNFTFTELDLYEITFSEFLKFLVKIKRESKDLHDYVRPAYIEKMIKTLINTRIKVVGREVMVYTENKEFLDSLRKSIQSAGYLFRTVSFNETETWWEKIV